MALIDVIQRAFTLDELIRKKQTGTSTDLAKMFGISRRQVYNYLQAFNAVGKVNTYDHRRSSFVYLEDINPNENPNDQ